MALSLMILGVLDEVSLVFAASVDGCRSSLEHAVNGPRWKLEMGTAGRLRRSLRATVEAVAKICVIGISLGRENGAFFYSATQQAAWLAFASVCLALAECCGL